MAHALLSRTRASAAEPWTTHQEVAVAAGKAQLDAALWSADLTRHPLARVLAAIAWLPERLTARRHGPVAPPSATLAAMVAPRGPWTLLADDPKHGVELGLLWRVPAGGTIVPASQFRAFADPGFVKVVWRLRPVQRAGRTVLVSETCAWPTDARARLRLALVRPVVAVPAAVLRHLVLRAIARTAEAR
ncbi:hypothetical protein [Conexibacter sp. SYSU D00693]|uniref:hypothetical protein n=1 Tax=Conexibacter sp. SYSU D00693 TaxID=2812560 RepID=UPI00196A20E9|nr:hypothetical protein [Conexibacter sp. SYSU D00693]